MAALVCWGRWGWEELSFPSYHSVYLLLPLHSTPHPASILPHDSVPSRSPAASWLLSLSSSLLPASLVTPVLQAQGPQPLMDRVGGGHLPPRPVSLVGKLGLTPRFPTLLPSAF